MHNSLCSRFPQRDPFNMVCLWSACSADAIPQWCVPAQAKCQLRRKFNSYAFGPQNVISVYPNLLRLPHCCPPPVVVFPPKNALRVLSGMEHGRWRRAKCRPRCGPKSWLHIEGGKGEWDGERGKGQGEPQAVQRA